MGNCCCKSNKILPEKPCVEIVVENNKIICCIKKNKNKNKNKNKKVKFNDSINLKLFSNKLIVV